MTVKAAGVRVREIETISDGYQFFGFDIENDYIAGFDRGSWGEILMATNDFKPFATGSGANVLSQADYDALSARTTGF
jgi:hypothetical protein